MVYDLNKLREKLAAAGQEHVLSFWDELNLEEKDQLLEQIDQIDFNFMNERFEQSKVNDYYDASKVEPMPYKESVKMSQEEKEHYIKIGEEVIKRGEVAVISMAGGQRNKAGIPWTQSNFRD